MKEDIVEKVKQFVTLMNENDLSEIEVQEKAVKIRVKKADAAPEVITLPPASNTEVLANDDVKLLGAKDTEGFDDVKSPMVGTFYSSSSPGADPFVRVGDHVDQDTVVCIVEAMKIMNEVKSGIVGEIVEVLVKDASPVEYGQPIYRVRLTA